MTTAISGSNTIANTAACRAADAPSGPSGTVRLGTESFNVNNGAVFHQGQRVGTINDDGSFRVTINGNTTAGNVAEVQGATWQGQLSTGQRVDNRPTGVVVAGSDTFEVRSGDVYRQGQLIGSMDDRGRYHVNLGGQSASGDITTNRDVRFEGFRPDGSFTRDLSQPQRPEVAICPGPSTGGTAPVTGGTSPVTGGTSPVTGGTSPVTGGTSPVTGGTSPVTGGTSPVTGGTSPVTGGTSPVTGGTSPGDTAPVTGDPGPASPGVVTSPSVGGANEDAQLQGLEDKLSTTLEDMLMKALEEELMKMLMDAMVKALEERGLFKRDDVGGRGEGDASPDMRTPRNPGRRERLSGPSGQESFKKLLMREAGLTFQQAKKVLELFGLQDQMTGRSVQRSITA